MKTVTVERVVNLPLERVWSIVSNGLEAPKRKISVTVETRGNPPEFFTGAKRSFVIRGSKIHELVESVDPPNSFTYKVVSGGPSKTYLGRAEFKAEGKVTRIKWSGTFEPKILGTGWLVAIMSRIVITQFISALEEIKE